MIDRDYFYDCAKKSTVIFPSGRVSPQQHNGIEAVFDEWDAGVAYTDLRWLAYMLATAYHETAQTMWPIEEKGKGAGHTYGKRIKVDKKTPYTDTTAIFYGRGLVQLTWYENYVKAGKVCGDSDMLHHPELALLLPNAVKIMFAGMTQGWFTGKKLSNYFNNRADSKVFNRVTIPADSLLSSANSFSPTNSNWMYAFDNLDTNILPLALAPPTPKLTSSPSDWTNARRIINGVDCAHKIAGYGLAFYACLTPPPTMKDPFWAVRAT